MQAFSEGGLGTRTWFGMDCRSVFVCVAGGEWERGLLSNLKQGCH